MIYEICIVVMTTISLGIIAITSATFYQKYIEMSIKRAKKRQKRQRRRIRVRFEDEWNLKHSEKNFHISLPKNWLFLLLC